MRPTVADGLRALQEAAELAPAIRIELTPEYLRLIAMVEAMAQNQAGREKGTRWRGRRDREIRRGHFVSPRS